MNNTKYTQDNHKHSFQDKLGRYNKCVYCGMEKPATTELQKKEKAKRKLTIAVDFDGVIHHYSKGWHDGICYDKPKEGALEIIANWLAEYNVYILSTRNPFEIEEWLKKHNAPFKFRVIDPNSKEIFWTEDGVVGITNRKLAAFIYIDDRAYRFVGWNNIPSNLEAYV